MTLNKLLTNEHGVNYAEWLREIRDESFDIVPVTTRPPASVLDAPISAQIAQVPDSRTSAQHFISQVRRLALKPRMAQERYRAAELSVM